MILVLCGTTNHPFKRLHILVKKYLQKNSITEQVIVQSNDKNLFEIYKPLNIIQKNEIPFIDLLSLLGQARIIICHTGPGILFLAACYSNGHIISIPRLAKFSEHVNDHQLYFYRFLKRKKFMLVNKNSTKKLVKRITKYIESI